MWNHTSQEHAWLEKKRKIDAKSDSLFTWFYYTVIHNHLELLHLWATNPMFKSSQNKRTEHQKHRPWFNNLYHVCNIWPDLPVLVTTADAMGHFTFIHDNYSTVGGNGGRRVGEDMKCVCYDPDIMGSNPGDQMCSPSAYVRGTKNNLLNMVPVSTDQSQFTVSQLEPIWLHKKACLLPAGRCWIVLGLNLLAVPVVYLTMLSLWLWANPGGLSGQTQPTVH